MKATGKTIRLLASIQWAICWGVIRVGSWGSPEFVDPVFGRHFNRNNHCLLREEDFEDAV